MFQVIKIFIDALIISGIQMFLQLTRRRKAVSGMGGALIFYAENEIVVDEDVIFSKLKNKEFEIETK